jgi:hypothetical protein
MNACDVCYVKPRVSDPGDIHSWEGAGIVTLIGGLNLLYGESPLIWVTIWSALTGCRRRRMSLLWEKGALGP